MTEGLFGKEAPGRKLAQLAMQRLETQLHQRLPNSSSRISAWLRELSSTDRAEDRFFEPMMFPMLQLPLWQTAQLEGDPISHTDREFYADLVYSTFNGYYFVRLVDNVMDEPDCREHALLPATAFFHSEFERVYHRYFERDSRFWCGFSKYWLAGHDAAMAEAQTDSIDLGGFTQMSGQKFSASKIPLIAAAHHFSLTEELPGWLRFCDVLGCYFQMLDDLLDWRLDAASLDRTTYLLSEAKRRMTPGSALPVWIVTEGVDWALSQMAGWHEELRGLAAGFTSCRGSYPSDLERYLEALNHSVAVRTEAMLRGASSLRLMEGLKLYSNDHEERV